MKERFSLYEPLHDFHTYFHVTNNPSSPHSVSSRLDRFLLPALLFRSPTASPVVFTASHPPTSVPLFPLLFRCPITCPSIFPIKATQLSGLVAPLLTLAWRRLPTLRPTLERYGLVIRPRVRIRLSKGTQRACSWQQRSQGSNKFKTCLSLLLSHHICMLRHINASVQDASHISYLCDVCPSLLPLVSDSSGKFVDCGPLVATQALLFAPPPPSSHSLSFAQGFTLSNRAKFLSKQAPSSRERVGPLRVSSDSPEAISDEDRSKVA